VASIGSPIDEGEGIMLKGKAPLLVAGILGLLAALLAYKTIQRKEENLTRGWELTPVVVANQDITEGTVLDAGMVAEFSVPKKFAMPSVVRPNQAEKVISQKLLVPVQKGDLILWSHFRSEGAFEHLSKIVTRRMRAVSLGVSGAEGVSGWVRPNDFVDVLGTFQDPKNDQMVCVTLLQKVIVVATDNVTGNTNLGLMDHAEKTYQNVTFMMLPEEAEVAVLAAQLGKLHITLRHPEDISEQEQRGRATIETLFTGDRLIELGKIRKAIQTPVIYGNEKRPSH
jgi:pilus assembly protein CpaB